MDNLNEKTNSELVDLIIYSSFADLKNKAWELLATKLPANSELTYILRWCSDADLKNKAWELLATKLPTNSELTYILRWCSDADLKNKAGELLATKSPTNSELTYILEYCSDADLKNKAWELLATKSPTNSELTYILRWCSDADLKNKAWELLATDLGVLGKVNEKALIKEIAETVLSRPESLNMSKWHCGTSHCLAGWACVLNPDAMQVEKNIGREEGTRIAGSVFLPSYANLFYEDNDKVLEVLTAIANE